MSTYDLLLAWLALNLSVPITAAIFYALGY